MTAVLHQLVQAPEGYRAIDALVVDGRGAVAIGWEPREQVEVPPPAEPPVVVAPAPPGEGWELVGKIAAFLATKASPLRRLLLPLSPGTEVLVQSRVRLLEDLKGARWEVMLLCATGRDSPVDLEAPERAFLVGGRDQLFVRTKRQVIAKGGFVDGRWVDALLDPQPQADAAGVLPLELFTVLGGAWLAVQVGGEAAKADNGRSSAGYQFGETLVWAR